MALVTTLARPTAPQAEPPLRRFAADGRAWAERVGLSPIADEALLVEIGYAVVTQGEHQPDLIISVCERLGVPYKVTAHPTAKAGFTYVRRNVIVHPEPEPEPEPAVLRAPRDWGRGRDLKLDVRLSKQERDELAEAAEAKGISKAEYIRKALFGSINGDRAWRGETVDPNWLAEAEAKFEKQRWRGRGR